jgi:hypothetical protein
VSVINRMKTAAAANAAAVPGDARGSSALRRDRVDVFRPLHYRGRMTADCFHPRTRRLALAAGLLALGSLLSGCAGMSDSVSTAFADPAKYELYDCKQLEAERKALAGRASELQGLMAKAETGAGGAVVAEVAYRNDYIAIRGQTQFAEEAWRRNKCQETPAPQPAAAKSGKPVKPARPARPMASSGPGTPSTLPRDGSVY